MKLALISLPVCKLIDDCENWVFVWQESNEFCIFVILILWECKKSENNCIQHNRTILIILALRRRWFFFKNGGCYRRTGTIPSQYKGWLVIHLAPCDCNGGKFPKREMYSSIPITKRKEMETQNQWSFWRMIIAAIKNRSFVTPNTKRTIQNWNQSERTK